MITGPLASVEPEDFKKAWQIRRETSDSSVDAELFRLVCKPETDYLAAGYRASFLLLLIERFPELMAPFMVNGELSDAFLAAFAAFPLEIGGQIEFDRLLGKSAQRFGAGGRSALGAGFLRPPNPS
jgi:hypothetical protein